MGDLVLFTRRAMSALIPDAREIGSPDEWKNLLILHDTDIICVLEGGV